MQLPPGSLSNSRYLLEKVLGQRGFGLPYLAEALTLKAAVTIKDFLPLKVGPRRAGQSHITLYGGEARDRSPDKLHLTMAGPVKLLDFGAARYFWENSPIASPSS